MRLRNKETGKSVNVKITFETEYTDEIEAKTYKGEPLTLQLLAERFEDAPEEIKPFEEVAKASYAVEMITQYLEESAAENERRGVGCRKPKRIEIADQDYYEILPDGTKKTTFTWDEAMEIEKKTHGKWRAPTVPEWFAICAAFGRTEDGTDVDPQILREKLGLTVDEDGLGRYWSATSYSAADSRYLYFNASYLAPRRSNNKGYGFAVRCVAGGGE